MQDTLQGTLFKCITPGCPNMSYHLRCIECSALESDRRSLEVAQATCQHTHSITGEFETILRFLPEYTGGRSQPGYMLDICKSCMKELEERPYNPIRLNKKGPTRSPFRSQ